MDSNPITRYNIFYLQVFFRWVKAINEITALLTCFFYNMVL